MTDQGKPIARLIPVTNEFGVAETARAKLLSRLESQPIIDATRSALDDLYEDDY